MKSRFYRENMLFAAVIGLASLAGLLVRVLLFDGISHDFEVFLQPWMLHFRQNGGFWAIAHTPSNYNAPYLYILAALSYCPLPDLYLIKSVSVIFDFALAAGGACLLRRLYPCKLRAAAAYALLLLWPAFVLNSGWWAQCDSLYVSLLLWALWAALGEKPRLSVILAALAFSFKLQTVFFLPLYAVFLLTKHIRWRHTLLFPAVYALTCVPALMLGRSLTDVLSVYGGQTELYAGYLTLNAPSVYGLLPFGAPRDPWFALGLAAAALFVAAVLIAAWYRRARLDAEALLLCALLLALGIPWLLPSMHDRYFYLAEALAVVWGVLHASQWKIPAIVGLASYHGYHAYIFRMYLSYVPDRPFAIPALMLGAALIALCRYGGRHTAPPSPVPPDPAIT